MNTNNAGKMALFGAGMLVLATVLFETRDFLPSFAAKEVTATAELSTTAEKDDARVRRAFIQARQTVHTPVQLEVEPDPAKVVRNSTLTVRGTTEAEALADLTTITDAMKRSFAEEGPGEFLVNASRMARPVPNSSMTALGHVFRVLALVLALAGLGVLYRAWRISGLPKQILWGGMIGIGICALCVIPPDAIPSWSIVPMIVMPIPLIITALVIYKTRAARKAAAWATGTAEIRQSKTRTEREGISGAAKVVNKADVKYTFKVGDRTYSGTRISIGDNPADGVDAALKRYSKGATVPVYYNPANPEECVLERALPASEGCLYGGAGVLMLIGIMVCAVIMNGGSIDKAMNRLFPKVHHPLMTVCVGLMGVFCLLMYIAGRRHAKKAASWPATKGVVVSSTVERYISDSADGSSRTTPLYQAVIEYSYKVGGQEYHSTQLDLGMTAGSSQEAADQKAALYPVGMEVTVHHDPQAPGTATLSTQFGGGGLLLVIAAALFGVAIYAAIHP